MLHKSLKYENIFNYKKSITFLKPQNLNPPTSLGLIIKIFVF